MNNMRKERNVVLEWSDVKKQMLKVIETGEWGPGPNRNHHTASSWCERAKQKKDPENLRGMGRIKEDGVYVKNSWEGGSLADTAKMLRDGFFAKEFQHSASYVPMGNRPRPSWGEEDGDIDVSRLIGGYDNFMLDRAEREVKPGLRIMVEMAFSAGMTNKAIANYGAWVAGLIGSLEASGYDLTVDIWVRLDNLFNDNKRDNVLIRVKRENEVSDFTDWSQIFSPTGYRHTIFCAKMVAGDKIGKQCYSGLGHTIFSQWKLDYDPEDSTLKIMVDQRGYSAPIEELNKQAVALGLVPDPQEV